MPSLPSPRKSAGRALGLVTGALGDVALGALDAVLASRATDRAIEKISEHVLASPAVERIVADVVDSPVTERFVVQVIDSHVLDVVLTRLLEREELWLMIEEIAGSPVVTAAVTQQSLGFAEQVAAGVRAGSSGADAWLERAAGRMRRRRGPDDAGAGPAETAPAT